MSTITTIIKGKRLLYAGLTILTIGVLFKYLTNYQITAQVLIITGVVGKLIYLAMKIKKSIYRPGVELILLFVGLVVFFTGIYLRSNNFDAYSYFMITGIALKVAFIVMFIRKVA